MPRLRAPASAARRPVGTGPPIACPYDRRRCTGSSGPAGSGFGGSALLVLVGVMTSAHTAEAARRPAADPRAPSTSGFGSVWPTYHHDDLRTGVDPAGTTLRPGRQAWTSATLDGQLYGEPLVDAGRVDVATENDTVYTLAADNGKVLWSRHGVGTFDPDDNARPGHVLGAVPGRTTAFVLCSVTVGIAGLLNDSHLGGLSDNLNGGQLVLSAVAAAVIGGASLFGGRGVARSRRPRRSRDRSDRQWHAPGRPPAPVGARGHRLRAHRRRGDRLAVPAERDGGEAPPFARPQYVRRRRPASGRSIPTGEWEVMWRSR